MMDRTYEGEPIKDKTQYITERPHGETVEASDDDAYEGEDTCDMITSYLNKGQKVAMISAETGITDTSNLKHKIDNKYDFDVSRGYISHVLNSNKDVDGFDIDDDGNPHFEIPDKVKAKEAIVRKARLNPDLTQKEIQEAVEDDLDVDINAAFVKYYIDQNIDDWCDGNRYGDKKDSIIESYEKTGKNGNDLQEYIKDEYGFMVSTSHIYNVLSDYKSDDETDDHKTDDDSSSNSNSNDNDDNNSDDDNTPDTEIESDFDVYAVDDNQTDVNDVYTREEIESDVLKPIETAKMFADDDEIETLEVAEDLIRDLINK